MQRTSAVPSILTSISLLFLIRRLPRCVSFGEPEGWAVDQHEHGQLPGQRGRPRLASFMERPARSHVSEPERHQWTADKHQQSEYGYLRRGGNNRRDVQYGGDQREADWDRRLRQLGGELSITPSNTNMALRGMFASGVTATLDQGGTTGARPSLLQACKSIPGTQTLNGTSGLYCGYAWDGTNAWGVNFNCYNHWNTPNNWSCIASNSSDPNAGGPMDAVTAASNHPGGVNVCFCDGSVHFIKSSITPQTWWWRWVPETWAN